MVHVVGAGSGAPDLITVRGMRLLERADVIIYTGSLVNPALLDYARANCVVHDSARLTLEQVIMLIAEAHAQGLEIVRLHTGDPSLYGAIREQLDRLRALDIPFDLTPGVSSLFAAAAALEAEYTLPGVSQTLIVSRVEGRTPVPAIESAAALAGHGASMVFFLSAGLLERLSGQLIQGGCTPDTPAALVYKASWPDELTVRCTVGTLVRAGRAHGIEKTALVLVGRFLEGPYERSLLYDPAFTTGFRQGAT